jgi:hypothetical protein
MGKEKKRGGPIHKIENWEKKKIGSSACCSRGRKIGQLWGMGLNTKRKKKNIQL